MINVKDGQTTLCLTDYVIYKDLVAEKALFDDTIANDIVEHTLHDCQAFVKIYMNALRY